MVTPVQKCGSSHWLHEECPKGVCERISLKPRDFQVFEVPDPPKRKRAKREKPKGPPKKRGPKPGTKRGPPHNKGKVKLLPGEPESYRNLTSQQRWRLRNKEHYRTYMRKYMRKKLGLDPETGKRIEKDGENE